MNPEQLAAAEAALRLLRARSAMGPVRTADAARGPQVSIGPAELEGPEVAVGPATLEDPPAGQLGGASGGFAGRDAGAVPPPPPPLPPEDPEVALAKYDDTVRKHAYADRLGFDPDGLELPQGQYVRRRR